MKIYLCGPINGCTDEECNDWRSAVKEALPEHEHIDPMRRDYRGREDQCVNEIVELDKIDVRNCDVVIAACPQPSVGTSMEIFYAHQLGKPVVAVVSGNKISPWLRYHCTFITSSIHSATSWIKENLTS